MIESSICLLSIAYELRHAMQFDRGIKSYPNGLDDEIMKYKGVIFSKKNIATSTMIPMPEMIFAIAVINDRLLINSSRKNPAYNRFSSYLRLMDPTEATLRTFQSKFIHAIREEISENKFKKFIKMYDKYLATAGFIHQYYDLIAIEYLELDSKVKRDRKFISMAEKLICFQTNNHYKEFKNEFLKATEKFDCHHSNIEVEGCDFPQDILW